MGGFLGGTDSAVFWEFNPKMFQFSLILEHGITLVPSKRLSTFP